MIKIKQLIKLKKDAVNMTQIKGLNPSWIQAYKTLINAVDDLLLKETRCIVKENE